MTVSVPLVAVFGILVIFACRYTRLRAWQAIVAIMFGFLLAATIAAPEIRNLLSGLLTWLNKP
jgi:cell division protein FtsW (lipid II flippase)